MAEGVQHVFVEANGVRLHCAVRGEGRLIVLLHGFPEFWYSWRKQIPVLARRFKVVTPDMRGYNLSDKPEGVESYRLNVLVEDVFGLIRAFGERRAVIVGHDWGGVVAWAFAMTHPEATERLIVMNAPHPAVWQEKVKYLPEQLRRSWYIFFFQLEKVPERYFSRNNYLVLREMLRTSTVKEGVFSEEDIERYVEAWSQPGALTAGINYYRANIRPEIFMEDVQLSFPKVKSPTLVIWGEKDFALTMEVSRGAEKYVDAPYEIKYIPECGHWVQNEEPDLVNEYILDFLKDL
ncbi:MAG: alpha/beta fold hydrolase [Candidatus Freyarchaeota archaeon]